MGLGARITCIVMGLGMLVGSPQFAAAQSASTSARPPAQPAAPAQALKTQTATADRDYVLGPSDVIEVGVLGRKDFDTRGRISEDGTVQLPYLGSVKAAGMTTLRLADQLAKDLESGGYFSHPIVKVDIVSYASRYVTVLGNVGTPGLVPVDRPYRLSEILARVGGLKETGADYVVLRSPNGPERHLSLKTLATGDLSEDPYVSPGDKIYCPDADLFYISGQVAAPGTYKIGPEMTVRLAIARGGGLNAQGSEKKIKLVRKGVKIRATLETRLEPGDVIVIGERLF